MTAGFLYSLIRRGAASGLVDFTAVDEPRRSPVVIRGNGSSAWIGAKELAANSPANSFVGLRIKSGSLDFDRAGATFAEWTGAGSDRRP